MTSNKTLTFAMVIASINCQDEGGQSPVVVNV